jgi:hypothetical protein
MAHSQASVVVRLALLSLVLIGLMLAPKCAVTTDDQAGETTNQQNGGANFLDPPSPAPTLAIPANRRPRVSKEDLDKIRTELATNVWSLCFDHFPDAARCDIEKVTLDVKADDRVQATIIIKSIRISQGEEYSRRHTIIRHMEKMGSQWFLRPAE